MIMVFLQESSASLPSSGDWATLAQSFIQILDLGIDHAYQMNDLSNGIIRFEI